MSVEEKRKQINHWLRHHTNVKVQINFCDIYACLTVLIFVDGKQVGVDWGDTLEHRLDCVLTWIEGKEYLRMHNG